MTSNQSAVTSCVDPSSSSLNDCWRKSGIQGDASCQELISYVHCRNCPIYSSAAIKLLDRELPTAYLDEQTHHVAQEIPNDNLKTESAVIFRIGMEWLALSTLAFDEVISLRSIHSLPHRQSGVVLGLVNVRGELLICVSLSQVLTIHREVKVIDEQWLTMQQRFLVVRYNEGRIVFPVDEVHGIHRFNAREVREKPTTLVDSIAPYTKAVIMWCDKSVGWLDDQLLFSTFNRNLA